jgi:hypothetical protein
MNTVLMRKRERRVFGVSDHTALLANQASMNKKLETLTKEFHGFTMANKQQQVAAIKCDLCGEGHANGECVPEGYNEEANYMGNYQRPNQYYNSGLKKHPNLSYSNNNTLNPLMLNPQQQQQRKPSAPSNFENIMKSQEAERKNNEAARKLMETQIGQMAMQMAEHTKGAFSGNTQNNPKNESCNAIELRSKKVLTPLVPKATKKNEEVEEERNGQEVVEKDNGVVKNVQKEKNNDGEQNRESEKVIDADSILRKTKSQLLEESGKKQVVPPYVKLPYPHLTKKKEKEASQFKKFMKLFTQLQMNILFGEAID